MSDYSYSKEIVRNNVAFGEFTIDNVREMFRKIFKSYNLKVKEEDFDSFCEDFYNLLTEIHTRNERIWRMLITDMLFSYDEKGCVESGTTDSSIKRKQVAIITNVIMSHLRTGH